MPACVRTSVADDNVQRGGGVWGGEWGDVSCLSDAVYLMISFREFYLSHVYIIPVNLCLLGIRIRLCRL